MCLAILAFLHSSAVLFVVFLLLYKHDYVEENWSGLELLPNHSIGTPQLSSFCWLCESFERTQRS